MTIIKQRQNAHNKKGIEQKFITLEIIKPESDKSFCTILYEFQYADQPIFTVFTTMTDSHIKMVSMVHKLKLKAVHDKL